MQENLVLRQVTNLPLQERNQSKKQTYSDTISQSSSECSRPSLEQLIKISHKQIDFGYCLPGSIHQKSFTVTLQKQLEEPSQLAIFVLCEDQTLYDSSSLIFGIKRANQQQFYDDYRMKIKNKRSYQFKVGVKTPMFYQYDVKCTMYITFSDYAPYAVILKQKTQIPQILCIKQLYFQQERVIKLSVIHNRGKKQCRVPFKMNHPMTIAVTSQLIGLTQQLSPLIDVKPKSMTLSGKGQFSLSFTMNTNQQIKQNLLLGYASTIRRILILKIKQTQFTYHFPVQVVYYPENKKQGGNSMQQF